MSPAWSPDGRTIAFSGNRGGQFDIFTLDLETRRGDATSPTTRSTTARRSTRPTARRSSSARSVGENHAQLFRVDLADPAPALPPDRGRLERQRRGLLARRAPGWSSPPTATASTTSTPRARDGQDAAAHQRGHRLPHADRAASARGAIDQVVYTGFWNGSFDLYLVDIDQPVAETRRCRRRRPIRAVAAAARRSSSPTSR